VSAPVRVVIADDHPMFRYGLQAVLATSEEVELVGEAADGEQLERVVQRTRPDVVVTDLNMPGRDGLTAARSLLERDPELPVLVLTMHDDDESVFAAMRAGVRGYLLKGADRAELVGAVMALAHGDTLFGPSVARRIIGFYLDADERGRQPGFPGLTPREHAVLDLVASGKRNSAIAAELGLSEKTVRNHLSAVFAKLQVPDRSAAIVRARQAGLGRAEPRPDRS
jgi:DNA-binding NarL/FixJ family response regulator